MRSLREALLLALAALAPAALAVAFHPDLAERSRAGLEPGAVRLAEILDWEAGIVWVDARGPEEFARDHVPDAVLVTEDSFDAGLGDLLAVWRPGMRVVVYCSSVSCDTSREVARRLHDAGLDDVFHLHGGWEAWQAAYR